MSGLGSAEAKLGTSGDGSSMSAFADAFIGTLTRGTVDSARGPEKSMNRPIAVAVTTLPPSATRTTGLVLAEPAEGAGWPNGFSPAPWLADFGGGGSGRARSGRRVVGVSGTGRGRSTGAAAAAWMGDA